MNQPINRVITLTGTYVPLISEPLVGDVSVAYPYDQSGTAYVLSDIGTGDVPIMPGEAVGYYGVDLSALRVKGPAGNLLVVKGNTRGAE